MRERQNEPSHDYAHALNVLHNCQLIARQEGGDMEILYSAALFHDVVIYPKNHPLSPQAPEESASLTLIILKEQVSYPAQKITQVCECIRSCSFNKQDKPSTVEVAILRDAYRLAATGAIAIMRTFASSGQMSRALYNIEDPFAVSRETDPRCSGLDLFYQRLLIVKDRLYTKTAKAVAEQRTEFLKLFFNQLKMNY